jgi:hypothetical protein
MSKKGPKEKSGRVDFESIASIISTFQMYPAEAGADIEKLRKAVWKEFSPSSPYEEYLTEEVIQRMLESKRQRQLRKSLLDMAFQEATRTALNLTRDDVNEESERAALYHKITSEVRDAADIEAIDRLLVDYGASLDRIQLNAHRTVASDLEVNDRRQDILEKKLRQLERSIREIQAQRRQDLISAESLVPHRQ